MLHLPKAVRYLACALLLCLLAPAIAQQREPVLQSFDLQVPWHPEPTNINGKQQLIYELHLRSFAREVLTLKRLRIIDRTTGATLGDLQGEALRDAIGRPDQVTKDQQQLPPGSQAVIYLSLPFASKDADTLAHIVDFDAGDGAQLRHASIEGATVVVHQPARPLLLGPPFRDGMWAAIYDASWPRGHRRVLYAVDGAVHVPGRFAIDWIKVDRQGSYVHGDADKAKDWLGYGADILAVTDGVIASARDDMRENSSVLANARNKVPLEQASGNYVAIDLGDGHHVFYEHLKPGSVRVKVGDHVRRGQVIGQLGYTGESTGPHLHMHVADANSPLNAEGIPYAFEQFHVLGAYPSIDSFGKSEPWQASSDEDNRARRATLPAPLNVVEFSAKP
ncbi:Peptidase family M23 [Dyella sp. OK004]|uniref:M23 family metallopeptidase n=1 Tax=Dyella sp. OK004 TaxID=1855292 RepID=UPI0008F3644F|nr:M23 family metallopeptidase [Dyella sp. OK004]SFS12823.1 Peptidase family M23 [Dyella sp. OK004]